METTNWRRRCARLALLLFCLASLPVNGTAQDKRKDYALIFGTVWSANRQPVYGIRVRIRPATEKKARWELMSDHNGEFAQRVPPGKADYVIWADLKGSKGKAKPETIVHVENDERVDVSLHLTE